MTGLSVMQDCLGLIALLMQQKCNKYKHGSSFLVVIQQLVLDRETYFGIGE